MLLLSTRLFLIVSSSLIKGYSDKVKITAPNIAKEFNMNSRALMPALRRLTQVGLLNSQVGGSNPGFILARDPAKISMYDIITALEGDFCMSSCRELVDDVKCEIQYCDDCSIYKIINRGLLLIINDLKDTTLREHSQSMVVHKE